MTTVAGVLAWIVTGLVTHYRIIRIPEERARFDDELALLGGCVFAWPFIWGYAVLELLGRVAVRYIAWVHPPAPDAAQLAAEREVETYLTAGLSPADRKD